MDPAVRADTVVADAAAAEGVLVEVPGDGRAVLGVHGRGLAVGGGAGAPGVGGLRVDGALAGGLAGQGRGVLAAAGGVLQRVGAAGQRGGQRDAADEDAVAGAGRVGGLHLLVGGQDRAAVGVGDQQLAARGAVGAHALDGGAVGQARGAVGGPDDQLGVAAGTGDGGEGGLVGVLGYADGGLHRAGRLARGLSGRQLRAQRGGRQGAGDGLVGGLDLALGVLVHDQVAAEHGKPVVGALVAEVAGAVGVDDGVLDHQLLLGAQAQGLCGGGGLRGGQRQQFTAVLARGVLGGGRVRGGLCDPGTHLDRTGQQGRGRENGSDSELSLHVRVPSGSTASAVRTSFRGTGGQCLLGRRRVLTCSSVRSGDGRRWGGAGCVERGWAEA